MHTIYILFAILLTLVVISGMLAMRLSRRRASICRRLDRLEEAAINFRKGKGLLPRHDKLKRQIFDFVSRRRERIHYCQEWLLLNTFTQVYNEAQGWMRELAKGEAESRTAEQLASDLADIAQKIGLVETAIQQQIRAMEKRRDEMAAAVHKKFAERQACLEELRENELAGIEKRFGSFIGNLKSQLLTEVTVLEQLRQEWYEYSQQQQKDASV